MTEKRPVSVKGLVFDMDGLLLDSERLVKRSWDHVGNLLGYKEFGNHIYNTVGFNLKRRTEYFRTHVDPDFPMDFFADATRKKYHQIAESEGVDVKPGARELLEWAKNQGARAGDFLQKDSCRTVLKTCGTVRVFSWNGVWGYGK